MTTMMSTTNGHLYRREQREHDRRLDRRVNILLGACAALVVVGVAVVAWHEWRTTHSCGCCGKGDDDDGNARRTMHSGGKREDDAAGECGQQGGS